MEARERGSKAPASEPLHPKVQAVYAVIQADHDPGRSTKATADAIATSSGLELAQVLFDLIRVGFTVQEAGEHELSEIIFALCQEASTRLPRNLDDGSELEARLAAAKEWSAWSNESRVAAKFGEPPKQGSVPLATLSGFQRTLRR